MDLTAYAIIRPRLDFLIALVLYKEKGSRIYQKNLQNALLFLPRLDFFIALVVYKEKGSQIYQKNLQNVWLFL